LIARIESSVKPPIMKFQQRDQAAIRCQPAANIGGSVQLMCSPGKRVVSARRGKTAWTHGSDSVSCSRRTFGYVRSIHSDGMPLASTGLRSHRRPGAVLQLHDMPTPQPPPGNVLSG